MPINDNPTIFDTFVNEITKNLDDILDSVRKDFNGPTEDTTEETPEAPEEQDSPTNTDALSVEGLAIEAVRLLQEAEDTEFLHESEQLVAIADRYIRLTELALAADVYL